MVISSNEIHDRLKQLYQHKQELLKQFIHQSSLSSPLGNISIQMQNNEASIRYYTDLLNKCQQQQQQQRQQQQRQTVVGDDDDDEFGFVSNMDLNDIPSPSILSNQTRSNQQQQQQPNRIQQQQHVHASNRSIPMTITPTPTTTTTTTTSAVSKSNTIYDYHHHHHPIHHTTTTPTTSPTPPMMMHNKNNNNNSNRNASRSQRLLNMNIWNQPSQQQQQQQQQQQPPHVVQQQQQTSPTVVTHHNQQSNDLISTSKKSPLITPSSSTNQHLLLNKEQQQQQQQRNASLSSPVPSLSSPTTTLFSNPKQPISISIDEQYMDKLDQLNTRHMQHSEQKEQISQNHLMSSNQHDNNSGDSGGYANSEQANLSLKQIGLPHTNHHSNTNNNNSNNSNQMTTNDTDEDNSDCPHSSHNHHHDENNDDDGDDDVSIYSEMSADDLSIIADHELQDLDDLIEDDMNECEHRISSVPSNEKLLQTMHNLETDIKQTDADRIMDQWEQTIETPMDDGDDQMNGNDGHDDDNDDDDDGVIGGIGIGNNVPSLFVMNEEAQVAKSDKDGRHHHDEEDDDDDIIMDQQQSSWNVNHQEEDHSSIEIDSQLLEQELNDLEREAMDERRKQQFLQSQEFLMDLDMYQQEYESLAREMVINLKKRQLLHIFFYKLVKSDRDNRRNHGAHFKQPTDDSQEQDKIISEEQLSNNGKVVRLYQSGKKVVINLPSRSVKVFLPNGHIVTRYRNGDMKRIVPKKCIEMFIRNSQSCSITHADHSRTFFSFALGQCEKRFPEDFVNQFGVEKIVLLRYNQKILVRQDGPREVLLRSGHKKLVPRMLDNKSHP